MWKQSCDHHICRMIAFVSCTNILPSFKLCCTSFFDKYIIAFAQLGLQFSSFVSLASVFPCASYRSLCHCLDAYNFQLFCLQNFLVQLIYSGCCRCLLSLYYHGNDIRVKVFPRRCAIKIFATLLGCKAHQCFSYKAKYSPPQPKEHDRAALHTSFVK